MRCVLLYFLLLAAPGRAATLHVPADYASIAAGLAASSAGDTVLVADGMYYEHNLSLPGDVVLLGSGADGWYGFTAIDGVGLGPLIDCAFSGESLIKDLRLRNGSAWNGGAAISLRSGTLTLSGCVVETCSGASQGAVVVRGGTELRSLNTTFRLNAAEAAGGAIHCEAGRLVLEGCIFAGNTAGHGGALYLDEAAQLLELVHCTFAYNAARSGAAIQTASHSAFVVDNSILAFSPQGEAVAVSPGGSVPTFACCDIYGNAGGDWTGPIAGQLGQSGNLAVDPEFCARPGEWRFDLQADSPCAAGGNECLESIGALDFVNCGWTAVARRSWSAIKALY